MPYIKVEDRAVFDTSIDNMLGVFEHFEPNQLSGICNYIITRLLDGAYSDKRYDKINSAIGVLECAKMEFYRRRAAGYEDEKIEENGDAYGVGRQGFQVMEQDEVVAGVVDAIDATEASDYLTAYREVKYHYSPLGVQARVQYLTHGQLVESHRVRAPNVAACEQQVKLLHPEVKLIQFPYTYKAFV